jgi:Arc/MetJ-type ribon-helix-helix transcriptional regulator
MKTQPLHVSLTEALRPYVKEKVRAGTYQNEKEVLCDAIRQMQRREIEEFKQLFGDYSGAPPTADDQETIHAAINPYRESWRSRCAA